MVMLGLLLFKKEQLSSQEGMSAFFHSIFAPISPLQFFL